MQEVLNQPPPLAGLNLFSHDRALHDAVVREGAAWALPQLEEYGAALGTEEMLECGNLANEYPPVLRTHDRYGERRDEVVYHPSWHTLMRTAVGHGIHSLAWASPQPGAHVARAALAILAAENEAGHMCPVSMTYAAVPALRHSPKLASEWESRICSAVYDPTFQPAPLKKGALVGMAMTEKQGGSDVRANITRAQSLGDGEYELYGHKWFCSAPMSDAFLVLAQAPRGLSCFLLPRWKPDGRVNAFHLQRLKPKLGNRSNASSEVELDGAWAQLLGEEGRGVATIMEMVQQTRLDCVLASTAIMRRAVVEARHHAAYRHAFGRALLHHPLMRNVLADLTLESEAATLLAMRLARAFDEGNDTFARLGVAVGKYWITKRTPPVVAEALECLGGNGFVEECALPRLYREAPLNSIWAGSGNVIALDVLRALARQPECLDRLVAEIRLAYDQRLEAFVSAVLRDLSEAAARRVAEGLALALQSSLLIRFSPRPLADAFCATRISADPSRGFGALPAAVDIDGILSAS